MNEQKLFSSPAEEILAGEIMYKLLKEIIYPIGPIYFLNYLQRHEESAGIFSSLGSEKFPPFLFSLQEVVIFQVATQRNRKLVCYNDLADNKDRISHLSEWNTFPKRYRNIEEVSNPDLALKRVVRAIKNDQKFFSNHYPFNAITKRIESVLTDEDTEIGAAIFIYTDIFRASLRYVKTYRGAKRYILDVDSLE